MEAETEIDENWQSFKWKQNTICQFLLWFEFEFFFLVQVIFCITIAEKAKFYGIKLEYNTITN